MGNSRARDVPVPSSIHLFPLDSRTSPIPRPKTSFHLPPRPHRTISLSTVLFSCAPPPCREEASPPLRPDDRSVSQETTLRTSCRSCRPAPAALRVPSESMSARMTSGPGRVVSAGRIRGITIGVQWPTSYLRDAERDRLREVEEGGVTSRTPRVLGTASRARKVLGSIPNRNLHRHPCEGQDPLPGRQRIPVIQDWTSERDRSPTHRG